MIEGDVASAKKDTKEHRSFGLRALRDLRGRSPRSSGSRRVSKFWKARPSMIRKGRAGSPLPAALSRLHESEPYKAGAQRSARPTCTGSGTQCVCLLWKRRLHERSRTTKDTKEHRSSGLRDLRDLRGRSPRGSGSQCVSKFWKTRLSMNRKGRAGSPLPAALSGLPDGEPPKAGAQRSARPTATPLTRGNA